MCDYLLTGAEGGQAGRGIGSSNYQDLPEWKKNILGGPKASYGKKEKRSIMEQRQVNIITFKQMVFFNFITYFCNRHWLCSLLTSVMTNNHMSCRT